MLRKAALLLSGNAAASLLALARNLLIASLIPVADYGIAATFAVAMAVVEMVSALGLQQQIVQAKEGEDEHFQAALQGFQVLRGLAAGVAMLAIALPLAGFLNIPEAAWGYMVLALVPVLNALQHFDIHRLTRSRRFGPMILTGVVPPAVSFAAVWPLAHWLQDWRAMLAAILIQALLAALVSHLAAERRYRLVFDRSVMARSLRFGWPLLLNGALLFLVLNGDKLIVGRELGMEALAIFAMGVTLTLTPTFVISMTTQSLLLPRLSEADRGEAGGRVGFERLALAALQATALMSLGFLAAVLLVGEPFVWWILGAKFAELLPWMGWLGLLHALRVVKTGPALVALSAGETRNAMMTNIPRLLLLPVAWAALAATENLGAVVAVALVAETAGLALAFVLLHRTVGRVAVAGWRTLLAALAGFAVAGAWNLLRPEVTYPVLAPLWVWGLVGAAAAAALWSADDVRAHIRRQIRRH